MLVEVADPMPLSHPGPCVGVDRGITTLATLSTGETICGSRALADGEGSDRRLWTTVLI